MAENPRHRKTFIAIVALLLVIALALLLSRCLPERPAAPTHDTEAPKPPSLAGGAAARVPLESQPEEILTSATLVVPERVTAGAAFRVTWTGPDNSGDFVTIVRNDAPSTHHGDYQETRQGKPLELTAPIEPGAYEARYVTARSHTILGRAPIEVISAAATIEAPTEVALGAPFSVAWTGPNNTGDYITIVAKDAPDAHYGSYTDAGKTSPQSLTAPTIEGDAELRYVTGQAKTVLARRTIRVVLGDVSLSAPADAIAGSTIAVRWTGPNNGGDYVTVVAGETPDGHYGNYTVTSSGSPLSLLMPIISGAAELRYMTGQGNRVLARRPIRIIPAEVTLKAPAEGPAGAEVSITWTGPDNPGDYITIVANDTPEGQYAAYALTSEGSPLSVQLPKEAGDAEVRYMTGQGNKVLARIVIKVVP